MATVLFLVLFLLLTGCPPFRAMHVTENGAKNYIKSAMLPGLVAELTGLEKKCWQ